MGRLAAVFGGLLGVLLVPLALAAPTAWLLLPVHLAFTVLACIASLGEGLAGRAERARLWGFGHLVATLAMVGALELGSGLRDSGYWMGPWALVLLWAWVPPALSGVTGWVGERREAVLSRQAVRRRKERREREAG